MKNFNSTVPPSVSINSAVVMIKHLQQLPHRNIEHIIYHIKAGVSFCNCQK